MSKNRDNSGKFIPIGGVVLSTKISIRVTPALRQQVESIPDWGNRLRKLIAEWADSEQVNE